MDWKMAMDELLRSKSSAGLAILLIGYFFGDEGLKYFMGLDPELRTQLVNGAVALSAILIGWSRIGSVQVKQKLETKVEDAKDQKLSAEQELADARRLINEKNAELRALNDEVDSLKKSPPSTRPSRAKKVTPKS